MEEKYVPQPFPWQKYSKKCLARIERPFCVGFFYEEEAQERKLFLTQGASGEIDTGNKVIFSLLVSLTEGTIIDARFTAYGDTAFLAACEIICELGVGKTYVQAAHITLDTVEKHVRDKKDIQSIPSEAFGHVRLSLEGFYDALSKCMHIPIATSSMMPSMESMPVEEYSGWASLSDEEKLQVIEQVLIADVRPFIEQDAGGVNLLSIQEGKEVLIQYTGACATCFSSTGATLSFIQHILRSKVHASIIVRPVF